MRSRTKLLFILLLLFTLLHRCKRNDKMSLMDTSDVHISDHQEAGKIDSQDITINIYWIRHSKSKTNDKGFTTEKLSWAIRRDTPLSERGRRELLDLRKKINSREIDIPENFDLVGCSILRRAIETANILFGRQNKVYVLPYLREDRVFPGNYPPSKFRMSNKYHISIQKNNLDKSHSDNTIYKWVEAKNQRDLFSSESFESDIGKFLDFLEQNFDEIIDRNAKKQEYNIAIVTHSRLMKKYLFLHTDKKRPWNLSIYRWKGRYITGDNKFASKNIRIHMSPDNDSGMIFRGFPK